MTTNILLTCNSEDFDIAMTLKSSIEDELGIHVIIHIEDDSDYAPEDDLCAMIEHATVLLVFELGDSNISAWVTIDGVDIAHSNYKESNFPEAIDFSENFAKGIAVLDSILYTDFGLDLRPPAHEEVQHFTLGHLLPLRV
ncbi:MAG: hypothetical protein SGBAC_002520 [Bacillariaceae sp.]